MSAVMDRLFDRGLVPGRRRGVLGVDAAMDMYETDDAVIVKVSAPGVKPQDVDVSVVGDTLTIRGEVKSEEEVREGQYLCRELARGQFMRRVTLPGLVQADKAKAEFENGILTVEIPKAEEAKPKSIKVKAR
jgi:HSP20 family protein